MDSQQDVDYYQDLHHPELGVNLGIWLIGGIATLFLALRLYCRVYRMTGACADDYVLFVAWLALMAGDSAISYMLRRGFGTGPLVSHDVALGYAIYVLFSTWALTLTKTSWAITLLKITNGWQKWVCWFAIVTLLAAGVVSSFQSFASSCGSPTADKWTLPGGCWSLDADLGLSSFIGGYNALMELILAFLPWRIIWNLRLARAEKIGICISMSLGVIAAIVAIARIVVTSTVSIGVDVWYTLSIIALLSQVEQAITVIACSIPILRALLRSVRRESAAQAAANNSTESHAWALRHNGSSDSAVTRPPASHIVQTREVTIEYVGDKRYPGGLRLETLNQAEKQV
ncbi:hypothetical protein F5X99DRAFT_430697 [Biscogniauxia marginata]|nr:hypothetical protein F5X99DRAFT_430697 [Biscogniauxia marginata]